MPTCLVYLCPVFRHKSEELNHPASSEKKKTALSKNTACRCRSTDWLTDWNQLPHCCFPARSYVAKFRFFSKLCKKWEFEKWEVNEVNGWMIWLFLIREKEKFDSSFGSEFFINVSAWWISFVVAFPTASAFLFILLHLSVFSSVDSSWRNQNQNHKKVYDSCLFLLNKLKLYSPSVTQPRCVQGPMQKSVKNGEESFLQKSRCLRTQRLPVVSGSEEDLFAKSNLTRWRKNKMLGWSDCRKTTLGLHMVLIWTAVWLPDHHFILSGFGILFSFAWDLF